MTHVRIGLVAVLVGLIAPVGLAQHTKRTRPEAWENLACGGRFMDRFQPMPIRGGLTSDTWGADAVKPRDVTNGIEDREWSYWGGNIVLGDEGKYHLFVCRWREDSPKGHMAWGGSGVVRTVSDSVYGPFRVLKPIGKGHNPEIFRLRDRTYCLYCIGGFYRAATLDGPWERTRLACDPRGRRVIAGLSNLSFARREDGSILMVCRGGGIWISRDGKEPFRQITDGSVYPKVEGRFEDPVLWRTNVQYHLIVNDWYGRIAYHLRSRNGVQWKVDPGEAYLPGIAVYEDGTKSDWYKFERIKVFQDERGRATHANFAVIDCPKREDKASDAHSSKNIVIPLTVGRLLAIVDREKITADTGRIRLHVAAEKGFDPHTDVDVASLRFGAPEEVDFGRGCRPVGTEKDGKDLIVVFDGQSNGLTDDNFAAKLLGRDADGELLFGYARLPWLDDVEPILSTRPLKVTGSRLVIEVENVGQARADAARCEMELRDASGQTVATGSSDVPPLEPYARTDVAFGLKQPLHSGGTYRCTVTLHQNGRRPRAERYDVKPSS